MKARDVLVLVGLVCLVLVLTVAQKYAERRREIRQENEQAAQLQVWQQKIAEAFENRWTTLSGGLHATLDSIAEDIIASGVSQDSLAAVLVQFPAESPASITTELTPDSLPGPNDDSATLDSLASSVLHEYESALDALPNDLNTYEKRIATKEVAALVRARLGLSPARFDALLKHATASR